MNCLARYVSRNILRTANQRLIVLVICGTLFFMTNQGDQPATKRDLANLESALKSDSDNLRNELTQSFDSKLGVLSSTFDTKLETVSNNFDTKLETIRDEIIRAFQMTEESIRKDTAHVDEVADPDRRVTALEQKII